MTASTDVRAALHEQLARVGRAVAAPKRIELLELLCQGERGVDALAQATGMGITNVSQHLQVLRAAGLVTRRREGTRIHYRAADDTVCRFVTELGAVGRARLAEVERLARDHFVAHDELEPIRLEELSRRLRRRDTVVIDVRPIEEYRAGHIPGAISLPLPELSRRIRALPKTALVVAYCRGPFCVLAPEALRVLRARGFRARRLAVGFPEWRAAGYPVSVGAAA